MELEFKAEIWEWSGQGAWFFISLPQEYYSEIKSLTSSPKRGFGSVKVEAIVGKTSWRTSIFPDSKSGTYLLPIKKTIRTAENLKAGKSVNVKLRLIDF